MKLTPIQAWDQLTDAMTRIAALRAQRAAELDQVQGSFDAMMTDAMVHSQAVEAQLTRALDAHRVLIAESEAGRDISDMLEFTFGEAF